MPHHLSDADARVLAELADCHGSDANCLNFRGLADLTDLDRAQVRTACHDLRKRGLAAYVQVVFDQDTGAPTGAGYKASPDGVALARDLGLASVRERDSRLPPSALDRDLDAAIDPAGVYA